MAFLQSVLIPELRRRHPGATVLMDNLSAHKPADSDGSRPGFRDDLAHHSDLMSLGVPR
jgi:hypothetical protein